jgi:hypothetical protein
LYRNGLNNAGNNSNGILSQHGVKNMNSFQNLKQGVNKLLDSQNQHTTKQPSTVGGIRRDDSLLARRYLNSSTIAAAPSKTTLNNFKHQSHRGIITSSKPKVMTRDLSIGSIQPANNRNGVANKYLSNRNRIEI